MSRQNETDLFEASVNDAFGERLRAGDEAIGRDLWSAMANTDWTHRDGVTASYSFRAAGRLIAAVRGSGDYIDWYCSGPYAHVTCEIEEAMAERGWKWSKIELDT